MILADVTVGCQSKGRRASQSLIFLLQPPNPASAGPPAPASRGQLYYRAGLTAPYYTHRWPGHPSTHPHPSTFVASPPPCHSLPRSHHRPSRWCSRHGVVNVVNKRQHRKRDVHGKADSWDPHGPWPHASKYLLITPKRMNTPADSSDPPSISSHARKCLLITHKKMNTPPASRDPP